MSTERTSRPFGIRKATARSTEPVRRFTTEAAARVDALQISRDQGGVEWLVSGPTGTHSVKCRRTAA